MGIISGSGSFRGRFGDHFRVGDHFGVGIISGAVQIKHITSAPYHPATNGFAERCVESSKNGMKSDTEVKSLNIKLARFLLAYRNAPHSTTG